MPDGKRARPSEKRQVEGNGVGETFIRLQGKLQTYQKLITETGLAKTDFTRGAVPTRSLQMVWEAKWVREEVIGLTQTTSIFTSFGPSSQTHGFTEKNHKTFYTEDYF